MQEPEPIIETRRLRKIYRHTVAVDEVDLRIPAGICFGLLGPNGAGKTTTIEIMEDIIEPSSGEVLYRGRPRQDSFREEVGIQFQHTSLLTHLTVAETLKTFAALFSRPEEMEVLIAKCELGPLLKRRNDKLSGGQQQRLLLALALINRPSLIFLDEPSTGLDPQARRNLWQIVEQIKGEGKTIVLTTHSMEEAQYLCDQVAIMDRGKVIAHGTPQALIATYCGTNSITLPAVSDPAQLAELPYSVQRRNGKVRIDCDDIHQAIGLLSRMNIDLAGMTISSSNLEDVFLHLTGRQLRD